jgi:hypothetical protein
MRQHLKSVIITDKLEGIKMKKDIKKKQMGKQVSFQNEGTMQGGKKDPMKLTQSYGTGMKDKKPAAPLAKKLGIIKGK